VVGDAGYVFPAENVEALAATLNAVLDDDAERARRAAAGLRRADLFRREEAARRLFDLFDALVSPGRG
jgi:glycosyltransferase involved in cell wall biosynthesis